MAKNKRYQRTYTIHLDPRNIQDFEGVAFDFDNQKIVGVRDGKHYPLRGESRLEFTRQRENGKTKMLHVSSSVTEDTYFSSNHQLIGYDHLIAVDTNTHYLNDSSVSITAAFHLIPDYSDGKNTHARARVHALAEFRNVSERPENFGWWQVLQSLEQDPKEYAGNIGLIVDSDLGNHQAFNDRSKPIFADYYLPENVTIIYASDKGGAEHLSTRMIKYCHDLASDIYKQSDLLLNLRGLNPIESEYFTHFRQWDSECEGIRSFCSVVNK